MPCRDDVLCMAFFVYFQEKKESVKHFSYSRKFDKFDKFAKWRSYRKI